MVESKSKADEAFLKKCQEDPQLQHNLKQIRAYQKLLKVNTFDVIGKQIAKLFPSILFSKSSMMRTLLHPEESEPSTETYPLGPVPDGEGAGIDPAMLVDDTTPAVITEDDQNGLGLRFQKAFQSYNMAAQYLANGASDREVHSWLKENGPEQYDLPEFDTWRRYLRNARSFYKAQKNSPTAGRSGKSVANLDEI